MARRQTRELPVGKNALHLAAEAQVESIAGLSQRVVGEEKSSVRKKPPQNVDLFGAERLEIVSTGDVEKRVRK